MSRARIIILLAVTFLILLLGVGAGAWWYLFGPNQVDAAALVPGDTIFFTEIPNAAAIVTGYQTSQIKQLVDSPNSQPLGDTITKWLGQKNIDVFNAFAPNLSGQSFFAVTHFDAAKPEQIGLIAGMKPKAGMGSFDAFVDKVKTTWPDFIKQGTTGTGNVEGVDYQWIKGPTSSDKICVAQVNGWIVTAWGEATLQDWLQRLHKKAITPSLAENADYQKSISRIGKDPMTILYVDYHAMLTLLLQQASKAAPGNADADYLMKKLGSVGGLAIGTRFENGEIVDRFSFMIPQQAQLDNGMPQAPSTFDTLKFTGPTTRLYWGTSMNWQQYWKNLVEQADRPSPNPFSSGIVNSVRTLAQAAGVDLQHNVIDPLGTELSLQMEWNDDETYPEAAVFIQVAKPDDLKPTITALIDLLRKTYAQSAVINEVKSGDQSFAALKFVQASPMTFTMTEGGPYLGLFTSQNIAVRSFSREEVNNLSHNADFMRQIGDKRNGATQIAYLDTPRLLDRGYRLALPYVSLLSMFNKDLAAYLQGKTLPNDLTWLAPIGTWSYTMSTDADGVQGYSVSGIGNQGILLAFTGGAALGVGQTMGFIPKMSGMNRAPAPVMAPAAPPVAPVPAPMPTTTGTTTPDTTAPAATPAPDTTMAPATAAPTNAAPATPDATPPAAPMPNPDSTPAAPAAPATNSPTPTPDAPKPQ